MTAPLGYAPAPTRRGAPWWLWTLAALSVLGGAFYFFVPITFSGRTEVARRAAARRDIQQIRLALDTFEQDAGRYPTVGEGLGALVDQPPQVGGWRGPYLRRAPSDPWGRPYVYVPPAGVSPPLVVSH